MEFHGSSRRISHLHLRGGDRQGIYDPRGHSWLAVRIALWCGQRLRRPSRRADCLRIHSHRRALHQHPARVWPLHDSRKQHRPDHRLRRRVACRRRHVHDPRPDFSRLRLGVHLLADFSVGAARRMAWRAPHGSAAPPAHRRRARQSFFPGRYGMRRCSRGRRARRLFCRPRILGTRSRWRVHLLHEHVPGLDVTAGKPPVLVSRRFFPRQHHFGISRRRLHHRPARCRNSFRGRHRLLASDHACHKIFRPALWPHSHLPRHDSHPGHDSRSALAHLHSPDGRWRGRSSGRYHPDSHFANDHLRACVPASKMSARKAADNPLPRAASTKTCPCAP